MGKVIGLLLLLWGLAIPYLLYTAEEGEGKGIGMAVGGVMCIVFIVLGIRLLLRKPKSRSEVYYINRNYYSKPAARRRR